MSASAIDTQLERLQAQFQAVGAALMHGGPGAVQSTSAALQSLAVELVQMADEAERDQLTSSGRMRKIRALTAGMATLRENLMRQSAYVDRALEVLVPAAQHQSTYAGSGVFGGATRRSGEFKVFAA